MSIILSGLEDKSYIIGADTGGKAILACSPSSNSGIPYTGAIVLKPYVQGLVLERDETPSSTDTNIDIQLLGDYTSGYRLQDNVTFNAYYTVQYPSSWEKCTTFEQLNKNFGVTFKGASEFSDIQFSGVTSAGNFISSPMNISAASIFQVIGSLVHPTTFLTQVIVSLTIASGTEVIPAGGTGSTSGEYFGTRYSGGNWSSFPKTIATPNFTIE